MTDFGGVYAQHSILRMKGKYTIQRQMITRKPIFAWWRLLLVAIFLGLIGFGFLYVYSKPQPGLSQLTVFMSLLVMILFETAQAGWYKVQPRRDLPAPVKLEDFKVVLGFILFIGGGILLIFAVGSSRPNESLPLLAVGGAAIIFGLVLVFSGPKSE